MTEKSTALRLAEQLEAVGRSRTHRAEAQRDELLAALQEIVRNDPYNQSSAGIIARAVIAKVEGT